MEGPTPVSSLIHSATMVAAGLILLIKCNGCIQQLSSILSLLMCIGLLTSLLSSFESICIFDHKSVLAGSTCDQLGFMFLIYGCGNTNLSLFHFCTHAFYKSLLFLSLGAFIHQTGEQESRLTSILPIHAPLLNSCYQIGALSLLAFPGSISHYSKSLILNTVYIDNYGFSEAFWVFSQFSNIITGFNTFIGALGLYCIQDSLPLRKKQYLYKTTLYSGFTKIPLFVLSLLTLSLGTLFNSANQHYLLAELMSNYNNGYWLNSYFIPSFILFFNFLKY